MMKLLWTSQAGRHTRKETVRRARAQEQYAAAVRRAHTRSAHVAAAVASIPRPRHSLEDLPAQRSPID